MYVKNIIEFFIVTARFGKLIRYKRVRVSKHSSKLNIKRASAELNTACRRYTMGGGGGAGEWWWSMSKKPHFRIRNQKSNRSCLLIGSSKLSSIVNNLTWCKLQFTFWAGVVGGGGQWAKSYFRIGNCSMTTPYPPGNKKWQVSFSEQSHISEFQRSIVQHAYL